jgi:hypothetical protein
MIRVGIFGLQHAPGAYESCDNQIWPSSKATLNDADHCAKNVLLLDPISFINNKQKVLFNECNLSVENRLMLKMKLIRK